LVCEDLLGAGDAIWGYVSLEATALQTSRAP